MAAQHFHWTLELDGVDPDDLRVTAIEVTEALCMPYRVRVQAIAQQTLADPVLGKTGVLALQLAGEPLRWWHGTVMASTAETNESGAAVLEVVLSPELERLRLGQDTWIFQDQTAQDIVQTILKEGGIAAGDQEWKLAKPPPKRPYTVQYEESDLDFVERLLSEEGIAYAWKNDDQKATLLFFDDSTQRPDIDGEKTLVERHSRTAEQDTLSSLRECRVGASDALFIRDYDFQRPSFDASSQKAAPHSTQREVYLHPAPFAGTADGQTRVDRGLERLRVPTHQVKARSGCARLEAGRVFEADGSKRSSLNAEYLLISVTHRATLGDGQEAEGALVYENTLQAMPKDIPYRPELRAAPTPIGVEVAYVTCPPGEELHCDKWGRVKARFPWDRSGTKDDKSSTWLRVGQAALQGSMVLPRGTFEVVVDFERGNVDTPFISTHVYNEEAAPPYALPGGKTRSSYQTATTHGGAGANELRFEDAAGAEEIFLNASKDYLVAVENDTALSVKQHRQTQIGSNSELKVGDTHDHSVVGNRQMDVSAAHETNVAKDFSDTVGGATDLQVSGVRKRQVGGSLAESITGTLKRMVNGLLAVTTIRGYLRQVTADSQTTVGGAWLELVGRNRVSKAGGLRKEAVGGVKMIKAESFNVSCGAAYAATAVSENAKVTGSWTETAKGAVTMSAGGGMSIKATNVTFEGKNSLSVIAGGVSIKLSRSGKVEISAPNVDLKGVEALNQINHKSN